MKTIVVYYSNKGSNKYLAAKISKELSCPIELFDNFIGKVNDQVFG